MLSGARSDEVKEAQPPLTQPAEIVENFGLPTTL